MDSKQTKFITHIILIGILCALFYGYGSLLNRISQSHITTDSTISYISAKFLHYGQSAYLLTDETRAIWNDTERNTIPNLSPPFTPFFYSSFVQYTHAQHFYIGLMVAGIIFNLASLWFFCKQQFPQEKLNAYLVLSILQLAFISSIYNISFGEVCLLLNGIVIASYCCLNAKKDNWAGILLGIAINIKLFFGLFFIVLFFMKRYRALATFIVTALILATLPILFHGISIYQDYLKALGDITWYPINWNASYLGFLSRLFGNPGHEVTSSLLHIPLLTQSLYYLIAIAYIVLLKHLTTRLHNNFPLLFAISLTIMLLLSPLGWFYYFPMLIVSFTVFYQQIKNKPYYLTHLFMLLTLLLLLNLPFKLHREHTLPLSQIFGIYSLHFYCLFMLHILLIHLAFIRKTQINTLLPTQMITLLFTTVLAISTGLGFASFKLQPVKFSKPFVDFEISSRSLK